MEFLKAHLPFVCGLFFALAFCISIAVVTPAPITYRAEPTFTPTENVVLIPEKTEMATATPPTVSAATTTATSTPTKLPPKKKPPQTAVSSSTIATIQNVIVSPSQPSIDPSFEKINETVRTSLVNVLCLAQAGSGLPSFSGSGLIIDSRGIVITNAHVAEHLLLKNYKMPNAITCTIRTGSPARNTYTAELMYLPPSWIQANAFQVTSAEQNGTGEDDFAFLRVTGSTNDTPLPSSFSALTLQSDENEIHANEAVLVAAYPAGFLSSPNVESFLYPVTSVTTLGKFYTFTLNTLDLLSLGGTAVSQQGSSGGGAIDASGKAIALIVTSTTAENTIDRDLRAITFAHISRSLIKNVGLTLSQFLAQDPATAAKAFSENTAPGLTALLSVEYDKK